MNDPAREYFWGITLDKNNSTYTWSFEEEDEDSDFLIHTLFLKQAVLGASAVKDERNIVQVETTNFDQKELKMPLLSLTLGKIDQTHLDISFGHEVPVIFRLVEGSGPVHLSAQQLVEYPEDRNTSQDESELECTEEEEEDLEDEEEEEEPVKSKKRKASSQKDGKSKDDEEDEDEDESMEEDDEEEEVESSPEKGKKSKKGKGAEKAKKGGKLSKPSPKATKKGKKAVKAK